MLAEKTKNENLSDYILSTTEEMNRTKATGIENPVLSSVFLSQKILNKEKGVEIIISSDNPLRNFTANLYILAEVVDMVLELFIENEIKARSLTKAVFVNIMEDKDNYWFELQ